MTETTKFSEIVNSNWDTVGNISDLKGELLTLLGFELIQDSQNEVAIVELEREDGTIKEKRHTFSGVLIKQLKQIEPVLRNKKVLATVTKRKNYYTFE